MRKAWTHVRRWLAYHIYREPVIEEPPMAAVRYYSTDPEDSDPRSTMRPGEW